MATLSVIPKPVSSPGELIAMAQAMEREAAERYRQLAARMRLRQECRLAELFTFLSEIEEKHVNKIESRAQQLGATTLRAKLVSSGFSEVFDQEEDRSRTLTPYRALAIAVRNEDRAFAFYSYVAAGAPNEAVRKLAEDLAKDELEHAHLLRRERRKAFRTERLKRPASQRAPKTLGELWTLSAETESHAADYHRALSEALSAKDARLASLFAQAADDEANCAREAASRGGALPLSRLQTEAPSIEDGLRLLEESFEGYSDIAEYTKNESVMHEAQNLAAKAVKRLSLVYGSVSEAVHGSPEDA